MKNTVKLIAVTSVVLLSGCVGLGPQASLGDRMKDNFLFTSAANVSPSEVRCVRLTKSFTFKSGSVIYTLPAGSYQGTKKNSTGYFYYAPSSITSSSSFYGSGEGIYINNEFNGGNIFDVNATGFDSRPIRFTVLPKSIFSFIKKNARC